MDNQLANLCIKVAMAMVPGMGSGTTYLVVVVLERDGVLRLQVLWGLGEDPDTQEEPGGGAGRRDIKLLLLRASTQPGSKEEELA